MQDFNPEFFKGEALQLIEEFGGYVTESRDWKEECKIYFINKEIEECHWDTIYYEALEIQKNSH